MARSGLIEAWRREERMPRVGWDSRRLRERREIGPLPWDYPGLVRAAIRRRVPRSSGSLLDIGTGGGELLSQLGDVLPERAYATEGWPPNLPVARARLAPLGVSVLPSEKGRLPFEDEGFDLVINRMAGYRAAEVARVLRPGGGYLTQQLDTRSHESIRRAFGRELETGGGSLGDRVRDLQREGLEIETASQHAVEMTYRDVAAIVIHLAGMPWVVPGFSVDRDLEHLLALQAEFESGRTLAFPRTYLLIQARKGDRVG